MTESKLDFDQSTRHRYYDSPQTPTSTLKSYPTTATSYADSSYFSSVSQRPNTSRKRSRNDSWDHDSAAPSPAPFANMNYRLAGGQDTPGAVASYHSAYDTATPDVASRRGRTYETGENQDYFHQHAGDKIYGMPGRDGNGRAPQSIYQPAQSTWSSLVFGLAGKVFNFCTVGTFQGFFSGGGQGYSMSASGQPVLKDNPPAGLEDSAWLEVPKATSVADDIEGPRAAKKTKTSYDNAWVMVNAPESPAIRTRQSFIPRPSSPALSPASRIPTSQNSTASTATIGGNKAVKRPIGSLRRVTSTRAASSAGLRSPSKPMDAQQWPTQPVHQRTNSIQSGSTNLHKRRSSFGLSPVSTAQTRIKAPLSAGTPASHQGVQTVEQAESPLAKETRRHLNTIRKNELAEDREIMRMNRQLKDLIKQGQEALGTKVEVDYGENDDW